MATMDAAAGRLREVFGFSEFREGQEAVISRLLAGRSALAIFPTGAGKSMCYQLPALLFEGVTLVVSPLIALMKDQIDFLVSKGVAAGRLDSSIDVEEFRRVVGELTAGRLKMLFVAPERFGSERFVQTLKRAKLSMMAVDEAHCISEWGHSFRPDYLKLARFAKELGIPRVLGLTATATPGVATQIARAFEIAEDDVVRTGFYRSNLELRVVRAESDRVGQLVSRMKSRPRGPTIVYVTLQRTSEEVAGALTRAGLAARAYHAGLDAETRTGVQDWFMGSGDAIVVATIAFGMGIDKANLRYVYHYNLPKSVENYAQEIGRAGRDGEPAVCETLADAADAITLANFTYGDTPTAEAVAALVTEVMSAGEVFDVSVYELSNRHDIRPLVVETLLTYLELLGHLRSTGPFYNEYKFQPRRSSAEILAKYDAERAGFLKKVLARAAKAKTWFSLDVDACAREIGEGRQRIVAALNYLEEQGDLTLQVAGVRQGYRRMGEAPELRELSEKLARRFVERERRDVERLDRVLDYAGTGACRWGYLAGYFGEARDKPCGHCDVCAGEAAERLPKPAIAALSAADRAAVRDLVGRGEKALATPRQLARFLAGLNSPATSRARMTKDEMFGRLAHVPFAELLALAEGALGDAVRG